MTWLYRGSLAHGKANYFARWTNSELALATGMCWWKRGIRRLFLSLSLFLSFSLSFSPSGFIWDSLSVCLSLHLCLFPSLSIPRILGFCLSHSLAPSLSYGIPISSLPYVFFILLFLCASYIRYTSAHVQREKHVEKPDSVMDGNICFSSHWVQSRCWDAPQDKMAVWTPHVCKWEISLEVVVLSGVGCALCVCLLGMQ